MDNKKLEIRRQIFHLVLGIVLVFLLYYEFLNAILLGVFLVFGIAFSFIAKKRKIPIVSWFLNNFERKDTISSFPGKGVIFYFAGALLVVLLFPKNVALASILVLAFGDSIGHLFGMSYGKRKFIFNEKKFVEGIAVGFITSWLVAMVFVSIWQAFLGAFFGMLVESMEIKINQNAVDDNVLVPLVAGFFMWIASIL